MLWRALCILTGWSVYTWRVLGFSVQGPAFLARPEAQAVHAELAGVDVVVLLLPGEASPGLMELIQVGTWCFVVGCIWGWDELTTHANDEHPAGFELKA